MAGSYPDAPSRRMAWDTDGTVVVAYKASPPTSLGEVNQAGRTAANDETSGTGFFAGTGGTGNFVAFIFPELRDIDGFYGEISQVDIVELETSTDTTNGLDGTWTTNVANYSDGINDDVWNDYRDYIHTAGLGVTGKRGFRFKNNYGGESVYVMAAHIYGKISAGQTPDKLVFIDVTTGLEFTLPIDWGDVPRGTVHDKTIRLKNESTLYTANDITLSFEDLYLGSSSWYTIKETGGAFASTLAIDKINPTVTYPTAPNLITIRKTVPDDETLGLHAARLKANTTTWADLTWEAAFSGSATVTAAPTVS